MAFWKFSSKPTPTGILCIYMNHNCIPLTNFFLKKPKTTKKPYLYHGGIDMV